MKSRTSLYILLVLVIFTFGGIWLFYRSKDPEPMPVLPATINRDCAPWDGSAFKVSVPLEEGATLNISIYRSPQISLPATFIFPDRTGNIGNTMLILPDGSMEELQGSVSFQHVEMGVPAEGQFDLVTAAGQRLSGPFKAQWGDEIIMCG